MLDLPGTKSKSDNSPPSADELPNPHDKLPDIVIYSHSDLFYWWPVWLTGFILSGYTYAFGRAFSTDDGRTEWIHPNSGVGVTYMVVLLLVIIITNTSMRGIYSVTTLITIALAAVALGWAGLLDDLLSLIPNMSIFLSAGFYFTFSLMLLIIWSAAFFIFDRLTFYRIRPGQMTRERLIGDSEQSFDVRGMLFEKHGEDYFRHKILGLGAGDLCLKTAGANKETIDIPNVLFVDRKVSAIQRLIAIHPEQFAGTRPL